MSFLSRAQPAWDETGYIGGQQVPEPEPAAKASPVAAVVAVLVLLIANLYGLAEGRGLAVWLFGP